MQSFARYGTAFAQRSARNEPIIPGSQMHPFMKLPLAEADPAVAEIVRREEERQQNTLELIASENHVSRAVREAAGSVFTNKYAEGYPGKRYYGGCINMDAIETLAPERGKQPFGCEHLDGPPHSRAHAH